MQAKREQWEITARNIAANTQQRLGFVFDAKQARRVVAETNAMLGADYTVYARRRYVPDTRNWEAMEL